MSSDFTSACTVTERKREKRTGQRKKKARKKE
jgi:hypothetical protein